MVDINQKDIEKLYGALANAYLKDEDPVDLDFFKNTGFMTWDDKYLKEHLNELVNIYEKAYEEDDEYFLEDIEQDKHLSRSRKYK
jgi:hypothetical protein